MWPHRPLAVSSCDIIVMPIWALTFSYNIYILWWAFPIIKIVWSHKLIIFIMGIPIPGKTFYILNLGAGASRLRWTLQYWNKLMFAKVVSDNSANGLLVYHQYLATRKSAACINKVNGWQNTNTANLASAAPHLLHCNFFAKGVKNSKQNKYTPGHKQGILSVLGISESFLCCWYIFILMAWRKTAVTPLLTQQSYCRLAPSHQYVLLKCFCSVIQRNFLVKSKYTEFGIANNPCTANPRSSKSYVK